jgi:hypothetical protein
VAGSVSVRRGDPLMSAWPSSPAVLASAEGDDVRNHGIVAVSQRLGPARASTALDVYGHRILGAERDAAELIGTDASQRDVRGATRSSRRSPRS